MKITNFKLIKQGYVFGGNATAEVDVETVSGVLFWKKKKTSTRLISREYASSWFFADTGEWTPGFQVDALERSWKAVNNKNIFK